MKSTPAGHPEPQHNVMPSASGNNINNHSKLEEQITIWGENGDLCGFKMTYGIMIGDDDDGDKSKVLELPYKTLHT